ncbi:MAG: pectinesterase family protein [Bryobacteraceae bacterium]|jgi:polygalacturonase
MRIFYYALTAAVLVAIPALRAQDTRNVAEPRFPAVCAALEARLAAPNGALPESSETKPDTARLQSAIDACPPGQAVELKPTGANNIFLAGPLQLKPGVTLLIDAGAALFGSRNPRDYDLAPGSCGMVGQRGRGCRPLILADRAPGSGIMGDGAIDGRGGAKLLGQDVTWWDLAHTAKVLDQQQSCPRMLAVRQSDNFTLYRITLRNSPNFHVGVDRTNGFTAWGVRIQTPKTARNTDGIDPSSSTNVTITHCYIATGDDNVAIKSSGMGPATHMTIADNHFYSGHGMSIGSGTSGGVSAIRVTGLTIDGADNGIRIKSDRSRGGLVQDVVYEHVCMRDVVNPIVLTTMYTTFPGNSLPIYRDILLKDVRSVATGRFTLLGLDAEHKLGVAFDNVSVDGLRPGDVRAENAEVRIGPRRGNFVPAGNGVSVADAGAIPSAPLSCEGRFVPFPEIPTAPAAAVTALPEDKTFYVAASGTGDYYSIQQAIDVAPSEGAVISVAPGTYREVLTVTKPNLRLRSPYSDPRKTAVVFNKSAGTAGGIMRSATVDVRADNFTAENLTFANDFNATHPQEPQGSQALALRVVGDGAVFRNVRILGNQDTLYTGGPGRQRFSDCYIEGNVDFIFGDGKSVFENCEIHSTPHSIGFITAQGKRSPEQDSVFVFNHCKLTAEPGVSNVWLGRPWRPYASVVFLNTEMGPHIQPAGWREWHPGETHSIETAFYAEYNSSGPGADPKQRDPHTKQLSAAEAARFETER